MDYSNKPWLSKNFQQRAQNLRGRTAITRSIRSTFRDWEFQEVITPALQVSPGLEPHLSPFETKLTPPTGKQALQRYLHTSPEFAMKKILAGGEKKIFQLAQVFRNQERSTTHHPEFTMLEWYRAHATYLEIMQDCEELIRNTVRALGGDGYLRGKGNRCDPFKPFFRLSIRESFLHYAKFDLFSTIDNPQNPSADKLLEVCRVHEIHTDPKDTWEDLFFRVFLEKIEPHLGVGAPTILYDYPISMAALSRPKESDPSLAERFELYICGMEVANAFGELTNRRIQEERFISDMNKKEKLYGYRLPIDQDFLQCLDHLPTCAGIALGVDRLVMLATGANSIEEVLWIPVDGHTP